LNSAFALIKFEVIELLIKGVFSPAEKIISIFDNYLNGKVKDGQAQINELISSISMVTSVLSNFGDPLSLDDKTNEKIRYIMKALERLKGRPDLPTTRFFTKTTYPDETVEVVIVDKWTNVVFDFLTDLLQAISEIQVAEGAVAPDVSWGGYSSKKGSSWTVGKAVEAVVDGSIMPMPHQEW